MENEGEGWESASSEEDEEYDIVIQKDKKNTNEVKIELFTRILRVLQNLNHVNACSRADKNIFLQYVELKNTIMNELILFGKLVYLGVKSKLFVILDDNKERFILHVFLPEILEYEKIKTSGLVFSISYDGYLINETILHSSKFIHLGLFNTIITEIAPYLENMEIFRGNFRTLDLIEYQKCIFSKIPRSINGFKHHPFYVIESILQKNQYIHPLRPVLGYFKGDPVYLKENVKRYHSEATWYKKGRRIKEGCHKKYFALRGKKLFRIYETEEISIDKITGNVMDYFHKNHIPKDCCYISHDKSVEIANLLKIKYSECVVGFKYEKVVKKGIFCHQMHKDLILLAIEEYEFNQIILNFIERGTKIFDEWDRLLKKTRRFLELKTFFD